MEDITQLKNRVKVLEEIIAQLNRSDRYTIHKTLQVLDGRNVQFGQTTGTKLGLAATDKFAFHGSTPVVKRASADQAVVSGTADATYSANEATLINAIVVLVNELRAALVEKGIILGSA